MTITMVWGDKMKITIDNEEVLCDKNFTIEEEMLNTSSVILNNVYPATWEQDKDYTSRFYYPKDYSKCKIFNEIVHPTTREDAEGTSFSINVDTSKEYEIQTLKGQINQTGTPTPSSPQPINITTGRQVVSVIGKNLFDNTNINNIYSSRASISTINSGVRITSTSTGTGNYFIVIPLFDVSNNVGETYTIKCNFTTTGNAKGRVILGLCDENGGNRQAGASYISTSGQSLSYTIPTITNGNYLAVWFYVSTGVAVSSGDYVDYTNVMLEKGNQATTYEEYKGNDYEINLGKNLYYMNYTDFSHTWNSLTITSTTTGYSISNTATGGGDYTLVNRYITLPAGTYTMVLENASSMVVGLSKNNYTSILRIPIGSTSGTFTLLEETKVCLTLRVVNGTTYDETNNIMIEKGSVASSFSPYKTPIYLGEMRNYKDYIFRNTTENPLYDSNLEEGQWYIHKEIGRVVLNGSEPFQSYTEGFTITESNWNNLTNNNCMSKSILLSNYYENYTTYADFVAQNYGISLLYSVNNLYIRNTDITSVANFKTWLSSHNTEVYYVLNTPTNTLIEDEELINQLNSIELLDGLNNVSVSSPYLPFIMSLMYNYQEGYTEEDMLFCGVVENTGNISLNPRHPHYCNLQVLDFKTFLSEGETLDFVIYEKTILETINQVIGTISDYGFVLGNVNILHEDDIIGAYSTKDKTAYDVFNYIADITQSRWTTRMVDENTVAIDFYDPSLMPEGVGIDYTQEWFCDNNIIDMSFSYSSRDYRNKQVMLSGEVYANIETTEIIVADGYQTQFNTTGKIGYVSSLLLNGNPATIITKEEYDLGYEGDFVYQPGNTYFESVNLVSTGAIITIVYFAIIEGREVVLNQEEISRVSEMIDRKGVIARYENRNDATTTQELQAIGQSYLKYKGNPEVLLKVETLNNIWNIGERVEFDSPLEELTTEYMVKKKTINYITTQDNIFYTYELSSSFNSETEINYFDNQRSKMMGNIGAGEYISRNIDIENTANVIFYDLEVNEVVIDGNSTLQSELQTPLGVE